MIKEALSSPALSPANYEVGGNIAGDRKNIKHSCRLNANSSTDKEHLQQREKSGTILSLFSLPCRKGVKDKNSAMHADSTMQTSVSAYQSQQDLDHTTGNLGIHGVINASNSGKHSTYIGPTAFMNQDEFDARYQFVPPKKFSLDVRRPFQRFFRCCAGLTHFLHFLTSFFPIAKWLPKYTMHDDLPGDFMAGITIGVIHVPQGIAYAILTGVPPAYGLYSCFFGVLFYMLFGTSKYVSIGTMAIVSLMTATSCREAFEQIERDYISAEIRSHQNFGIMTNIQNNSNVVPRLDVTQVELVQLITLTAGLIQIVMAILRVEFLASYLSDQLVNAFCSSAAIHVVIMQLAQLGQTSTNRYSGPGYLLWILRDIITNIASSNYVALGISAGSFVFLYVGKEILNPKMRKHVIIPVPYELLLMTIVTVISTIFQFNTLHGINVVNKVPTGLPALRLPRIEFFKYIIDDALRISFVIVALHLSLCKVFNRRMSTKTDNNMELYAMGLMGSLSSFFGTYPVCSALGRTMLACECGAKTQLASIFSALLLLIVILFIGPLLAQLPMCVLAVLIIFSMKSLFLKIPHEILHLWRVSKIDFMIWTVTFTATLSLNVMQGLAVSVSFALLTTVFRIQWPHWYLLSNLSGTDYYRDSGRYRKVTPLDPGIRIFRFDAPLLFTNVEHFQKSVFKALTGVKHDNFGSAILKSNPSFADASLQKNITDITEDGRIHQQNLKNSEITTTLISTPKPKANKWNNDVESLIIDCTGFTFIDYTSVNALADLFHQLTDLGIDVFFAHAKAPIRDFLLQSGFFKSVSKGYFFPTTHDAVLAAQNKRKWKRRRRGISELSLKRSTSVLNKDDDAESLCVGEREFFLSSFKNLTSEQEIIPEQYEEEEITNGETTPPPDILEKNGKNFTHSDEDFEELTMVMCTAPDSLRNAERISLSPDDEPIRRLND